DAIFEILRKNPVDYKDIREINCWVHPNNHIAALPYMVPNAELEGKFSMPFVLAVACIYGSVELSRFTPEVVRDTRVIDLCKKVNFLSDENMAPLGARVSIVSTADEVYSAATDRPRG